MANTIVLGAQWGDEGKGKIIDALAATADVVVRFQGGANAGHTVYVDAERFVFHLLPSGVLRPKVLNLVGNGLVVDVIEVAEEIRELAERGVELTPQRLMLSTGAHVVTPAHRIIDGLLGGKIGTTGRGIGPTYTDKARRRGVRLGSLLDGTFRERVLAVTDAIRAEVEKVHGAEFPAHDGKLEELWAAAEAIRPFVGDVQAALYRKASDDAEILFEGGQGTLLDIDHGTYPFVTSSNTTIGGAYSGSGVFLDFHHRIAVMKAYTTRVGNGPFPTEQDNEIGEHLRARGDEYGATTGRPRRCGWLDLPLLRKAIIINGFNEIALTKLDCLDGIDPIRVAVGRDELDQPVYEELEGWTESVGPATHFDALPAAARAYIGFLERRLGVPVRIVSTGPGRDSQFERALP